FVTLAEDLGLTRQAVRGACLRDAALLSYDPGHALMLLEHNLNQYRRTGDIWGECIALRILGRSLVACGQIPQALVTIRSGLTQPGELADRFGVLVHLVGLTTLALQAQSIQDAVWLWNAVEGLRESLGTGYVMTTLWPNDRVLMTATPSLLQKQSE